MISQFILSRFGKKKRAYKRNIGRFLWSWVRQPRTIGAFIPSSRSLVRAMVRQIDAQLPGHIIELGAGTGVMTQGMLEAGIAAERLFVLERDLQMYLILKQHFPHVRVVHGDAMQLAELLAEHQITKVNSIISSLPLLSMPLAVRTKIIKQMIDIAINKSRIIQFTYGYRSPIDLIRLRKFKLSGKKVKTVIANFPPAHVWVYQPSTK